MSKSYYAIQNYCYCCKRKDTVKIGLASGGNRFLFFGSPEVKDFDQWLAFVKSAHHIEDEYSHEITIEQLLDVIIARKINPPHSDLYRLSYDKYGNAFTVD